MICRNARHRFETMVFNKHRIKSLSDPTDYVQYFNALEYLDGKGIVIEIQFSWWSFDDFKGKQFCVFLCWCAQGASHKWRQVSFLKAFTRRLREPTLEELPCCEAAFSLQGFHRKSNLIFFYALSTFSCSQESIESSLQIIHDIATENIGTLCISKLYSPLKIPLNTERYDAARQKSDLASVILQDLGFNRHSGKFRFQ